MEFQQLPHLHAHGHMPSLPNLPNTPAEAGRKALDTNNISAVLNDILQIIGGDVPGLSNITGPNAAPRANDPTSLYNALAPSPMAHLLGDIKLACDDLEKLLARLQMSTTEEQIKLAQERIKLLKDSIKARCSSQLKLIQKSAAKMQDAYKSKMRAKRLGWLGAIISGLVLGALAIAAVATGGVATPVLVAAGIAFAMSLGNAVVTQFDGMEKLQKRLVQQNINNGMSRKEAQIAANATMVCVTIAISAIAIGASLAAGGGGVTNAVAQIIQAVGSFGNVAVTVAGTANSLYGSYLNLQNAKDQAELLKIQQFLEKLQAQLDSEKESLEQMISMLQNCVAGLMSMLRSQADTTKQILANFMPSMA